MRRYARHQRGLVIMAVDNIYRRKRRPKEFHGRTLKENPAIGLIGIVFSCGSGRDKYRRDPKNRSLPIRNTRTWNSATYAACTSKGRDSNPSGIDALLGNRKRPEAEPVQIDQRGNGEEQR